MLHQRGDTDVIHNILRLERQINGIHERHGWFTKLMASQTLAEKLYPQEGSGSWQCKPPNIFVKLWSSHAHNP